MKKPFDQSTEVLYSLLQEHQTTLRLVKLGICNPTAVITGLRNKGVDILCETLSTKNRYGRKVRYGVFTLANKTKASKTYKQLTQSA